mmetsp:Transcript_84941/g.253229  ORF Transcript_84941/g.253229 Transcript_84941/m.253229 type:complete len:213 (+) Transcript_84941:864-1502(+)
MRSSRPKERAGNPWPGGPGKPVASAPPARGCRARSPSSTRGRICPLPCHARRSPSSAASRRCNCCCSRSRPATPRRRSPQTARRARPRCSSRRPAWGPWQACRSGSPPCARSASATRRRPCSSWSTPTTPPTRPRRRPRMRRCRRPRRCRRRPPPCSAARKACPRAAAAAPRGGCACAGRLRRNRSSRSSRPSRSRGSPHTRSGPRSRRPTA